MSIRPVDMKTSLLIADDASKIRENQKNIEAGQTQQITQNRHNQETKIETVQNTEAAENQTIKKEDEDKKNGNKYHKSNSNKNSYKKEETKNKIQLQDGIHGLFDLKA